MGVDLKLLLALLLLVTCWTAHGFKAEEFKKCDDANFCKRNRNRAPGSSSLVLTSGTLRSGVYHGRVVDKAEGAPDTELTLEIWGYSDDIIRVYINEDPAKRRYRLPDVVVPELGSSQRALKDGGSGVLLLGQNKILVYPNPFKIEVYRVGEVVPALSLNAAGLFHFEQRREGGKTDADPEGAWEETFRSHRDSKPHGPEALSLDVRFGSADFVAGIPERATSLELGATRGPGVSSEPYRLYNLDVFEYLHESPFGLYGAVPFMMSHSRATGQGAGFFWLNAAEMFVDVLAPGWETQAAAAPTPHIDTHWVVESGVVDVFLFVGPSPKDVVSQYTRVTGGTALPQMFAIAYHQCRWNYKDEADVFAVDAGFEEHDIPYDVLWLDIEHTDGKKYMTWDYALFPHPAAMQNSVASRGRKMVTIVDPHMKRDGGFALHNEATSKGYYVKDREGRDFDGWCWPGSSSYLDVTDPAVRAWWADKFSLATYVGSTPNLYIWNDMNEPSVFNGPEVTMHKDNKHMNGVEHRDVHNIYGLYYHMATADGLLRRSGGSDRPFVLSRALFSGTQRVGPVWTGDNAADWTHLRASVPMVLALGVAGVAFAGADVGGFFGNPGAELMTRWYQMGAFYPFFRGHAHLDTKRREPWLFGEPYTSEIRRAIRVRYSLLPYMYTLFREANTTGLPVMRPLWMEFPQDAGQGVAEVEFMLGGALLVRPVADEGAKSVNVYLPGDVRTRWYSYWTGDGHTGGTRLELPVDLSTVPVYVRGGTIVVRKDRARRSSTAMANDPVTLVVALDPSKRAEGEVYLDDGKSYAFKAGAYAHRRLVFSEGVLSCTSKDQGAQGSPVTPRVERIVFLGFPSSSFMGISVAHVEGGDGRQQAEVELGEAVLFPGALSKVVVVRLPNVLLTSDWTIRIGDSKEALR